MKVKIAITNTERTMIVAALAAFGKADLANIINARYAQADPANDGPETTILMTDPHILAAREREALRIVSK